MFLRTICRNRPAFIAVGAMAFLCWASADTVAEPNVNPISQGTQEAPASSVAGEVPAKVEYQYPGGAADLEYGSMILRAYGLIAPDTEEQDILGLQDVQVSEQITVTRVPVLLIQGSTILAQAHIQARIQVHASIEAGGYTERGDKDVRAVVKGFTFEWVMNTFAVDFLIGARAEEKPDPMDGIRADALLSKRIQGDPELAALTPEEVSFQWLLSPQLYSLQPRRRCNISFMQLLGRFEPGASVTRDNASEVAAELIWTQAMGLTDGTFKALPDARRNLQALLLEELGFEIGNPTDPDLGARQKAYEKLEQVKVACTATWDEIFQYGAANIGSTGD